MITIDLLNGNETLKGLTDEQKSAIAEMSKSDEETVIGNRFSEVYRQLDATIEKSTGIKRDGAEKTYVYLERATKEMAAKYGDYDELKAKVGTLEGELTEARKGVDEAAKAQVASVQKELDAVRAQYNTLQKEKDEMEKNHKSEMLGYRISGEMTRAMDGLRLKSGLSKEATDALVAGAIEKIKKNNPSFEERDGAEVLIFHDAEGAPLLNGENGAKPFTAKELLTKELDALGILEKTAGKGAGGGEQKPTGVTSISGAATQVEARDAIIKELQSRGITRGHADYNKEFSKLWKDNGVDKLPLA